jgi:DNA-binding transcriptional LysR family regulator
MDSLLQWRLFASVARLGSFRKAAHTHGRSPQAVTRAVSSLEQRLGARLLHRTTRSVRLTDEGERYLHRCVGLLAEFDQLEAPVQRQAPLRGVLTLTAPVLLGQLHVLPRVTRFLAAHPDVDVRLSLLDRVVSLAEEGIDLGIRIGELPDSALRARRVGTVRRVVCASPKYLEKAGIPRAPDALARHACIAFTATTPIPDRWSFPGPGRRERSVAVHPRLVVNTGQAAIDAAVAGVGLVRVLSYQVASLVAAGKLRLVLERYEPDAVPVQWVHLPGPLPRLASAFLEFATQEPLAQLT